MFLRKISSHGQFRDACEKTNVPRSRFRQSPAACRCEGPYCQCHFSMKQLREHSKLMLRQEDSSKMRTDTIHHTQHQGSQSGQQIAAMVICWQKKRRVLMWSVERDGGSGAGDWDLNSARGRQEGVVRYRKNHGLMNACGKPLTWSRNEQHGNQRGRCTC